MDGTTVISAAHCVVNKFNSYYDGKEVKLEKYESGYTLYFGLHNIRPALDNKTLPTEADAVKVASIYVVSI